ncbi:MAG: hypothetical protein D6B27_12370 [Gammaproteobacteria bacterium]|nr:MAG: hypothetical protein D6B27_12370 [Gammaproteobacteria bacterium]
MDKNHLIFFIGDSIIQGLDNKTIHQNSENYGIGGDTTFGMLSRLPTIPNIFNADTALISIGINDFWFGSPSDIIFDTYDDIINFFPKSTKVLVNSIIPVDNKIPSLPKNSLIDSTNKQIHELCSSFDNCKFCDSNSALKDNKNDLQQQFHIGDGVHLSNKGYQVLTDIFIKKIRSSQ